MRKLSFIFASSLFVVTMHAQEPYWLRMPKYRVTARQTVRLASDPGKRYICLPSALSTIKIVQS
mgnify:FL=1